MYNMIGSGTLSTMPPKHESDCEQGNCFLKGNDDSLLLIRSSGDPVDRVNETLIAGGATSSFSNPDLLVAPRNTHGWHNGSVSNT